MEPETRGAETETVSELAAARELTFVIDWATVTTVTRVTTVTTATTVTTVIALEHALLHPVTSHWIVLHPAIGH